MDWKDDLITKHQDAQIDRALEDKNRPVILTAEILSRRKSDPDEDRLNMIEGRLGRAEVMYENASKDRCTFSEVIHYVTEKILAIDPTNARALTMRAMANARRQRFAEAITDAEAAIRANPGDDSKSGQYIRMKLPAWREDLERFGG